MIPFLVAAGLIAGVFVVSKFWKQIKDFLQTSIEKIQKILPAASIAGFKTYFQTGNLAQSLYNAGTVILQKFYSKNAEGKWQETIATREIDPSEIPADILAKVEQANGQAVDISDEVQHELKLEA